MKNFVRRAGTSALGAAIVVLSSSVYADEKEVTDFGKRNPSAEEVIKALSPAHRDGQVVTRSLRRDVPKAVSLELTFPTNSATLTEDAKRQLEAVGTALASEQLANVKFQVEGHADARGSASYNKTLSEKRAASVKSYLVGHFRVPAGRLQSIGKGKDELKDPSNPESEVNRRVEIVTATD